MKCRKQLFIIVITILIFLPISSQAQNVVQQLRDAYEKENTQDFNGAIQIYQQVISNSQADARQLSRAYHRLGRCYIEKGEKEEAAGCFEYVINNFPEQRVLVGKSKKDLQALGAVSKETPFQEDSNQKLQKQDASKTKSKSGATESYKPSGTVRELSYDHMDTQPSTNAFGEGGFAVVFDAHDEQYSLKAIRILCSSIKKVSSSESENFHVHVCDKYLRILSTFSFPYSEIPLSKKWLTLSVPYVRLPKKFIIWVEFTNNPIFASMTYEKFEGNPSQNSSLYISGGIAEPCTHIWAIRSVVDKEPVDTEKTERETTEILKEFSNNFLEAKIENLTSKSKYPLLLTVELTERPIEVSKGHLMWAIDKQGEELLYGRDTSFTEFLENNKTALLHVQEVRGSSSSKFWYGSPLAFQFDPRIKDMKEIIGTVKYYTAEGIEEIKSDIINFQEASKINKPKGTIKKINKRRNYASLTLTLQLPKEVINSVKFYDEEGKELESKSSRGTSSDTQCDFLCRISEQLPEKGYIVFQIYKNAKKHVDLFKIKDTSLSKLSL